MHNFARPTFYNLVEEEMQKIRDEQRKKTDVTDENPIQQDSKKN